MILQQGEFPLRPNGVCLPFVEHRCTVTLVWPRAEKPALHNSLVVDPCFSSQGLRRARHRLENADAAFEDFGFYFACHDHWDHLKSRYTEEVGQNWRPFGPGCTEELSGITVEPCPGHDPDLRAVRVPTEEGELWLVSDAILDLEWLTAWQYYWPNGYGEEEVVQTWRSVAKILAHAAWVIPGHGGGFEVTAALVDSLIGGFPSAEYSRACPDVLESLKLRLVTLQAEPG